MIKRVIVAATIAVFAISPAIAQNQAAAANPAKGPQMQLEPGGLATFTTSDGRKIPMGFTSMTRDGRVTYTDFGQSAYVVVVGDKVVEAVHISGAAL